MWKFANTYIIIKINFTHLNIQRTDIFSSYLFRTYVNEVNAILQEVYKLQKRVISSLQLKFL